jgi:DnaD/phage-associated family protein
MPSFHGFRDEKTGHISLPLAFFTDLLPGIDDLAELKLTLYVFWRLERVEGSFRYLRKADIAADARFMQGLAAEPEIAQACLDNALLRAIQRGTMLEAAVQLGARQEVLCFLNSPKGRAAVKAIEAGEWRTTGDVQMPVELTGEPPNIFGLYEAHIGPLTPMIADTLREAEDTYPPQWIEEAIRIAVEYNKRSWRYVAAILERWQEEGRHEQTGRDSEKDRRRYADWEKRDS